MYILSEFSFKILLDSLHIDLFLYGTPHGAMGYISNFYHLIYIYTKTYDAYDLNEKRTVPNTKPNVYQIECYFIVYNYVRFALIISADIFSIYDEMLGCVNNFVNQITEFDHLAHTMCYSVSYRIDNLW